MEKVKVSKKLFDLLESYNLKDETDENFINAIKKIINGKVFVDEKNLVLNGINPRMFLDCIYYGYELEETKEEKLLRYYNASKKISSDYDAGFMFGVIKVLELYDIKVNGINN